jgi:hypothetical protein
VPVALAQRKALPQKEEGGTLNRFESLFDVPRTTSVDGSTVSGNLGNFLRQAALPPSVQHWSLTTLLEKLTKIGEKVVCHARKVLFETAETAVSWELFANIFRAIPASAADDGGNWLKINPRSQRNPGICGRGVVLPYPPRPTRMSLNSFSG